MFARLFGTEADQVLVMLDVDDAGQPEVSFGSVPPGLGVCWFRIGFGDNDDGWDKAEALIRDMTEERARGVVDGCLLPEAAKWTTTVPSP